MQIDASPADSGSDQASPLLQALGWIARERGLAFSARAVSHGLPVDHPADLSIEHVSAAARRCGLEAEPGPRPPSSAQAADLPMLVLTSDTCAYVLIAIDRATGRASILDPARETVPRHIGLAELDALATGGTVVFRNRGAGFDETDGAHGPLTVAPVPPAAGLRWIAPYLTALWPAWLKVLVAALVINVLGLAMPLFAMQVYDRVLPNQALVTLWTLTAGIAIALLFELILRQVRASILDHAGRQIDVAVAAELFRSVMGAPLAARRQSIGAIANRIRDFDVVRDVFTSASVVALTDLLFIALIVVVLGLIAGPIAWVVAVAVPLVLVLSLLIMWPLSRAVRASAEHGARRHAILIESLSATETLKAVGAEGVVQRRWEDAVAVTTRAGNATRFWSTLGLNVALFIQQAVGIVVIVWGVTLVTEGQMSVGALIAAGMLAGRAMVPLSNIAMTFTRFVQGLSALRGIGGLLGLPNEMPANRVVGEVVPSAAIAFDRVSFTYAGRTTPALADVSLKIAPGSRVGIIGKVGSGKSTLGRVLARLYAPSLGMVSVGGLDVMRLDAAEVRASVAYVGQDADLIEGTLRDNITLGRRTASDAEIEHALYCSGADSVIASHPLGLGQPLGERGSGLSGGQKQAVALARAVLRQPKVLFLDEPSSAMDSGTEADLVRRLGGWVGPDRTLIVCTHRLPLLDLCDRLIVLDGGRVVADGAKADVMARLAALSAGAAVRAVSPGVDGRGS
jgi:ATP-binding cassette, subfamily C, bacterial LapB